MDNSLGRSVFRIYASLLRIHLCSSGQEDLDGLLEERGTWKLDEGRLQEELGRSGPRTIDRRFDWRAGKPHTASTASRYTKSPTKPPRGSASHIYSRSLFICVPFGLSNKDRLVFTSSPSVCLNNKPTSIPSTSVACQNLQSRGRCETSAIPSVIVIHVAPSLSPCGVLGLVLWTVCTSYNRCPPALPACCA